jgi:hypothetical protein
MERIKAAANSRLMRLAQKMIVGGALLLDRVANSIFITWRPDEEFQPGAPIGLERVLTRVGG